MDKMKFTSLIPRIRVFETRLLNRGKLERMVYTTSVDGVLDLWLQEPDYTRYMDEIKGPEDYEKILSLELQRVYQLLYELTPEREIIDVMTVKFDYHNLKLLIKERVLETEFPHLFIPVGTMDLQEMRDNFTSESYSSFSPIKRKAIEKVLKTYKETDDPQSIELILDHALYEEMTDIAKRMNDPFLSKFVASKIDLENLEALFRIKIKQKGRDFLQTILIDGGNVEKEKFADLLKESLKNIPRDLAATDYSEILQQAVEDHLDSGSLKKFDKLKDDYMMRMVKDSKLIIFGIEPIIAYLHAKEMELSALRVIMVGKLNNISSDAVLGRLRETYE